MKRFMMPVTVLALFVAILVVLVVGINNAPRDGRKDIVSPLLGKPAPDFTLPKLLEPGTQFDGRTMRGGWHLVNVWGTWCGECRAEHAMLLQIKGEGRVPIVGIDWKDEDAAAMSWLAQLGNPYQTVVTDHDGRAAIDWG
ncbi:MAG: redoxin family protein, partial [Gammaproteobacteria bacterium]|nr:redoxin family protein [Gammaproteobacteria bacterium]